MSLVCGRKNCKVPGDRPVGTGPMSKTLNTVCAYLITLQDMAYSTDFPNPDGVRATNRNFDILVYMAW